MARQARIVLPQTAHHIMQRAPKGSFIFHQKSDFQAYQDILLEQVKKHRLKIYAYCFLPNQIHALLEPQDQESLARAIGETNRRYARYKAQDRDENSSVFQNRFFSYPMDQQFSLRAARFIETLPVTARITEQAEHYLWSSAKYRIKVKSDHFLASFQSFHSLYNWADYLARPMDVNELKTIQKHLQTGRPRGNDLFLDMIEQRIGKSVRPQKRGRKKKIAA